MLQKNNTTYLTGAAHEAELHARVCWAAECLAPIYSSISTFIRQYE
jgi:hypothetical protein